jgi:two-component system sensor histidine kinase CpxA
MRSIFAKILLWSLGTFALSLVAYWAIWKTMDRRGPGEGDPFWSMVAMVEDEACRVYEEGGPEKLAGHLKWLDSRLPGEHLLTDVKGRDLATGADRSDLFRSGGRRGGPRRLADGRMVLVGRRLRGRYRFVTVARPWFEPPNILPFYGAIVLVILGMGSILAVHLITPLRQLKRVVDRVGRGDLSARAHSKRRDEIGELSRAVDEMADRLQTLLSAERRLLQDVSHELRSPLTRLDVAVELAHTSADRDIALGRIKREIVRLTALVDELLQLTRAEGDPRARVRERVPLDALVRDLVSDCSMEAEAKGCGLTLQANGSCSILGEHELLHRAVENVVRNAIRHAPEGTDVEVSLEDSDHSTKIRVRDRGPGVPEDMLGAIFDPFFRVEGHRSRASGGVGLGLAIARRAVDLHQGTIKAQNANPGLMVVIELPRTASEFPAANP